MWGGVLGFFRMDFKDSPRLSTVSMGRNQSTQHQHCFPATRASHPPPSPFPSHHFPSTSLCVSPSVSRLPYLYFLLFRHPPLSQHMLPRNLFRFGRIRHTVLVFQHGWTLSDLKGNGTSKDCFTPLQLVTNSGRQRRETEIRHINDVITMYKRQIDRRRKRMRERERCWYHKRERERAREERRRRWGQRRDVWQWSISKNLWSSNSASTKRSAVPNASYMVDNVDSWVPLLKIKLVVMSISVETLRFSEEACNANQRANTVETTKGDGEACVREKGSNRQVESKSANCGL